jgi:hypothetical protein
VLFKKLQNCWLILALCPCQKIKIFLINDVDVYATLKQVLNDIILSTLDGIENWGLSIVVNKIRVGTVGN